MTEWTPAAITALIAALTALLGTVGTIIGVIKGNQKSDALKTDHAVLNAKVAEIRDRQDRQGKVQATLLLNTPPTAGASSAPTQTPPTTTGSL